MKSDQGLRVTLLAASALFVVSLLVGPARAGGAEIYWPSQRLERLDALDKQVVELQRELFNARMTGDQVAVARLAPAFKEAKTERIDLLRALGQVQ